MKLNLSNITSGYGAVAALNANFDAIEAAVENTLSRDGTTPNEMLANLDMNGNDILNANAVDVASLTINGTPVQPSTGVTVASAFQSHSFVATVGQTSFSLAPFTPYVASVQVEVNGLSLPPADITVSGTNVVIPACSAGDEVVIRRYTDAPSPFPVASDITFTQAGTIQTRSVQSKLRDVVSVKDFGAVGDGITDDTNALIACSIAVQAAGGGRVVFPKGTYRIFQQGTTYSQPPFNFSGLSGVVIDYSEATIQVDPAKNWIGSNAALFRFTDCSDIHIIGGNFTSPAVALNGTFTGVEVVSLRGDCRGVTIPYLRVQNALAAVLISTPSTSLGSRNIWIGTVEATGCIYGINGANSGSNMVVDNLVTDGCGRSFFIYGTSHVKANVRSKNFKFSADCSISTITSGYNSITDHEINYTNVDTSAAASTGVGVRITHSYAGGVAGTIQNVRVRLNVNLQSTGIASAFEYAKDDASGNPDTTDRGHILSNLSVAGLVTGTPAFGASVQFGRSGTVFSGTDSFYQINLQDLRIASTTSQSISLERLMPSLKGSLHLNKINAATDINILGGSDPATYTSTDSGARLFVSEVICPNSDTYNGGTSINGVKTFLSVTSPVTVRHQYAGLTITNQFSGGTVVYNLPVATAGLQFSFAQVSGNYMRIDPNGTESIRGGAAGKYLQIGDGTNPGSSVTLFCRSSGAWDIIQSNGTTAFEP